MGSLQTFLVMHPGLIKEAPFPPGGRKDRAGGNGRQRPCAPNRAALSLFGRRRCATRRSHTSPGGSQREEIAGAVARGSCYDSNRHEARDADLATVIAEEVLAVLRPIDAAKRVFPTPRTAPRASVLCFRRSTGAGLPQEEDPHTSACAAHRRVRAPGRAPTTCTPGKAIDTRVPQEQTISVRWILHILRAIPLTPCWARARRRQDRREMVEHLRRYYANGQ